jgi:cell division protein FtsB
MLRPGTVTMIATSVVAMLAIGAAGALYVKDQETLAGLQRAIAQQQSSNRELRARNVELEKQLASSSPRSTTSR